MEIEMIIKTESYLSFLDEFGMNKNLTNDRDRPFRTNPLTDEIIIKKEAIKKNDTKVCFVIEDVCELSRQNIVNHYNYNIEPYDDVCVKLKLEKIEVMQIKK